MSERGPIFRTTVQGVDPDDTNVKSYGNFLTVDIGQPTHHGVMSLFFKGHAELARWLTHVGNEAGRLALAEAEAKGV